ncbi:hypothetical protein FZW96_16750 [Bacillus sp. BGMRC 2118]|nr:hypothetical protein FZW96_16750 [Bacillus sp. BGMRC 2118]
MYGLLNVGSLICGLIAWILPLINLTSPKNRKGSQVSFISFSACGVALCFQIFYTYHKVTVEDWGALMDTMYAVAFASSVLLIMTIVLNGIMFYRDKTTMLKG